MSMVNRYERGWAGHFICANRCRFRRNTLLECGESRVVVSTVGSMVHPDGFSTVGHNRHFETRAFHAKHDGRYWDADVNSEVEFSSPWAIAELDADDRANEMHEAVVQELMAKMDQEAKGEQG